MDVPTIDRPTINPEDFIGQDYIPITFFMQAMAQANPFPYDSTLSFEPFMRAYKEAIGQACEFTAAEMSTKFEQMEERLVDGVPPGSNGDFESGMNALLANVMPSMLIKGEPAVISPPFVKTFAYITPAAKNLLLSGDWEMNMKVCDVLDRPGDNIIFAGMLILNSFYGQQLQTSFDQLISLRNQKTKLEKHFKMNFNFTYVKVVKRKPLKKLGQDQINELLRNLDNSELWLEYLPPQNFAFEGIAVGRFVDITPLRVIALIKEELVYTKAEIDPPTRLHEVARHLSDFLSEPDIKAGFVGVTFREYFTETSFSLADTNDTCFLTGARQEGKGNGYGIYQRALDEKKIQFIEDLQELDRRSPAEQIILDKGFRSLMVYPIVNDEGRIAAIFEFGAPRPNVFNLLTIRQLDEFCELLGIANERFMQDIDNRTSAFIQDQFTSIHPSVYWKFEEVSTAYQLRSNLPDFDGEIEPILFKDIFPIYGQADIVGSSTKRNHAIQADLIDNLDRVADLMRSWTKKVHLHMLDASINKVGKAAERIREEFISSDESEVVELLTREVHPLLHQVIERFPQLDDKAYRTYFEYLDEELGIVYRKRKAYEQSVSRVNQTISNFVDEGEAKLQKVLPHYFEKYKTDGVEYNMYVGQSLLQEDKFFDYHLKEFRLWQLVQMCDITRLVDNLSGELEVPLRTAQLIFVYNHSLSIRFRMDEKQFDVDGAYNVRYEILKKRIDKAVIKGTNERLTVPGKVAIVYLSEQDRREYLEYLNYLRDSGYISENIEDVELEKLQGAEGLHALRVTVLTK